MAEPTYPLVPIMNILAAVLISLSFLTSNLRGPYNRGVVMLKGWVLVGLINTSAQTILWHNSTRVFAPVFCDISSHLAFGYSIGIPACSLIITRRLWHMLAGDMPLDGSRIRREALIDYLLALGAPALYMATYYIVQGARFTIWEDYGCNTGAYRSGVAILLLDIWPLLFPVASVVLYCWRICLYFCRHWRTVTEALSGPTGLDRTRYVRILALSLIDILISLPIGIILLSINIRGQAFPFWPGWAAVHHNWQPVLVSAQEWQSDPIARFSIYWNEWLNVVYALVISVLLGAVGDMKRSYRTVFDSARDSESGMRISRHISGPEITDVGITMSEVT
ncbi:fungal pheromone STE3G-protein-coupled receptor [Peniophora sp. CONT]|nr:fungal pheromone STE3G-protein-coupled receptor [Peniophora sp. CONT]